MWPSVSFKLNMTPKVAINGTISMKNIFFFRKKGQAEPNGSKQG